MWRLDKWKKLFAARWTSAALAQIVVRGLALQAGRFGRDLARSVGRRCGDLAPSWREWPGAMWRLQFVFSSGDPGEDLLKLGAGRALRRLLHDGAVGIQRIDGPNHSFTPLWSQEALTAALENALDVR